MFTYHQGSLKQYLQSLKAENNDPSLKTIPFRPFNNTRASQVSFGEGLPMAEKLKFCLHIAKGLQHLAEKGDTARHGDIQEAGRIKSPFPDENRRPAS